MMKAEEALALANAYTDEHGGGGGGTSDYSQLTNKPQINGETLNGNKTSSDLGLMPEYEVDTTPTEESDNLITSGGVWEADKNINDKLQGSKTATGNPITITDAEPMNAESVVVDLEPKQDLHGYDKPWAGGAGKNKAVLDVSHIQSINGQNNDSEVYTDNGVTVTSTGNYGRCGFEVKVIQGTTYTISMKAKKSASVGGGGVLLGSTPDWDYEYVKFVDNQITTDFTLLNQTITAETNTLYIGIYPNTSGVSVTVENLQVEIGNQATDFEPYSNICPISGYSEVNVERDGDTYTIDLDGTRYGGTLDVTNGVLTATQGFIELDGSNDETWTFDVVSETNRFYCTNLPSLGYSENTRIRALSNLFTNTTSSSYTSMDNVFILRYVNGQNRVDIMCNAIADLSAFKEILANNSLEIVYELATPLTIHLTPTQIQMLENTNNISTDGTNIQLKYQPNNVIGECKAYTDKECAKVLPTPPTTDGTYHLECSVSGGIPTVRWVSNS